MFDVYSKLPKLVDVRMHPSDLEIAQKNWTLIEQDLIKHGINDQWNLVAVCATVAVETGHSFMPVHEYGNDRYFMRCYWNNESVRDMLGNKVPQDAIEFCGRGFVQITGRLNYAKAAAVLSIPDLETKPELACEPDIAAKILSWYWLVHDLPQICLGLAPSGSDRRRWQTIRRKVNGGLNGFTDFMAAVKVLTTDEATSQPLAY